MAARFTKSVCVYTAIYGPCWYRSDLIALENVSVTGTIAFLVSRRLAGQMIFGPAYRPLADLYF
jgi:hypothetical protein